MLREVLTLKILHAHCPKMVCSNGFNLRLNSIKNIFTEPIFSRGSQLQVLFNYLAFSTPQNIWGLLIS